MIKIEEIRKRQKLNIIDRIIIKNKKKFNNKTGMCKVISNYISCDLIEDSVNNKIINTKDLGFNYEHEFVLVKLDLENIVIIDLTFEQFVKNDLNFYEELPFEKLIKTERGKVIAYSILKKGYSILHVDELKNFVEIFSIKKLALNIDKC